MPDRPRVPFIFAFTVAVLLFSGGAYASSQAVTVDFSKTKQIIDGFGGSSAWEGAFSDAVMDVLYKNGTGQLGLTILRLRIDPHAGWADEKSNATKAKARGAMVFATPWSPPESLKTVNNVVGGAINTSKYASFAAWMKSFWTYCGAANVDIMSIENEPDFSPNYECCKWTAQNFLDFCKTYAPAIGKPIMMPEGMDYNFALSDAALKDAAAAANISYIGGHFYGGTPTKEYTLAVSLGKHVWETEHYYEGPTDPTKCMSFAKEIFDCLNLSWNAYCWWWMTASGNGIISGTTPNNFAWILAQFSKWVRPGYYRVEATYNPQTDVYVHAFKGTHIVFVAMNRSSSSKSQTFTCSGATITSVQKYTSSQSKKAASDGTVAVTNNSFTATLDAQSVTTFVSTDSIQVGILPFKTEDGRYAIEKASVAAGQSDAMAPFIYLINGKRLNLGGLNKPWNQAPGIYIMPGNEKGRYKSHGTQRRNAVIN
jgi:glucuronoarabinoxylan endo-1,4-beta-xylanase